MPQPAQTAEPRILLVDDQPANLFALEALLGDLGVTLVRANSGEEALRRILEGDFAAILLDVQMPGMSGFEVARLLRARSRSSATPLIFLTAGESSEFTLEEAYDLGAVDYLMKPIVPKILRAKIAFFVDYFRKTQQLREAERRSAEAALREQRQLWQTTLSSIGDAVIAVDTERRVTFLNIEAERLTGWPRTEAVGRPLDDVFCIVNETTLERVGCPVRGVLDTGRVVGLANRTILIARDGRKWPLDDSVAPIRNDTGQLLGVVLVFRDITERKQAEREQERLLREVESERERLADVFQRAPSFMAVLRGPDHVFERANDRYFQVVGRRDILGRPIREALPEVAGQGFFELLDGVYRTGEAFVGTEVPILLQRGPDSSPERRFVDFVYQALRDPGGAVTGILAQGVDVTARKRAEEEVRLKDERLTLLVENIKDYAVVIADLEGTILEWQGGAERITGFAASEATGRKTQIFFTPEDRAVGRDEQEMRKAAEDGRAEDRRWHIRKDGSFFFADGVMVPLYDNAAKLRGFGKVFKDATGEEFAKESRQRHIEQLKTLADVSSRLNAVHDLDSVLGVLTTEGRALIGAHQAVTIIAADAAAVQAVSLSDERRGGETTPVIQDPSALYAALAAGIKPIRLTHENLRAHPGWEGFRAYVEAPPPMRGLLAVPIVGRSGEALGVVQLSDKYEGDFTEEDEAVLLQLAQMAGVAVENTQLYQALREADQRKDEFLAMLAHELRNPLAPMRNALAILDEQGSQTETAVRLREVLSRQTNHLSRLVDDLLDMARITSGKITLRREPVELASVVARAVETSRPLIDAKRHELAIGVAEEPVWLDADPVRLAQVFANLLNNAAKYTDEGGRIRIAASRDGDEAVIHIQDNGIGLSPEMLPRVFDLFTQASVGIARTAGGLGIGLTLVRKLVELHDGSVSVTSGGAGTGSDFVVRLPSAARTGALAAQPVPAPPAISKRVLIVDDNLDALDIMSMLLEMYGHVVETAADGVAAVEVARAFRPEVMFLDLGLPRRDGYEVARILRREFPKGTLLLIALSGYGRDEDRRRTHEAGFDDHLVKPVDPAVLERVLASDCKIRGEVTGTQS